MSSSQTELRRVGFFAGSFDPIHDGHLAVAKSAISSMELDCLFFMVEELPWGVKNPVSLSNRYKMVDIAIEKYDKMKQLEIADKQFSINKTLIEIERRFPSCELYFVFGADVFLCMNSNQWPGLDRLLRHKLVVVERGNIAGNQISAHADKLGIKTTILPSKHLNHSSTDVRLKSHKKYIWLPVEVLKYIDENNIYSDSASRTE